MKYLLVVIAALAICGRTLAQETDTTYRLSTHILDISSGDPAPGVRVLLERSADDGDSWMEVAEKTTLESGRINDFLPIVDDTYVDDDAIYRLTFYTKAYFEDRQIDSFFPFVTVVFKMKGTQHYHVPITLSPYGYTTYRGS